MVDVNPESPFHGERPNRFIVGVINDQQQAESAVNELESSGYTGDLINVLYGEEGAETLRHRGERPGSSPRLQRIRNVLEEFASGGADDVQRHVEAAEQGNYVVGVILPGDELEPREQVRQILKSNGGYDIIFVKGSTVEVLDR